MAMLFCIVMLAHPESVASSARFLGAMFSGDGIRLGLVLDNRAAVGAALVNLPIREDQLPRAGKAAA